MPHTHNFLLWTKGYCIRTFDKDIFKITLVCKYPRYPLYYLSHYHSKREMVHDNRSIVFSGEKDSPFFHLKFVGSVCCGKLAKPK